MVCELEHALVAAFLASRPRGRLNPLPATLFVAFSGPIS